MTTIPLVIILTTVALVCVVAWTQAAIWRRIDAHKRATERAITQLQDSLSAAGIPAHNNRRGQP